MSVDPKSATTSNPSGTARREHGVRVFTYPKLIFIFPTLIMALVCFIGMKVIGDKTEAPSRSDPRVAEQKADAIQDARSPLNTPDFHSPQNMMALLFLGVFFLNILVLTFDFPRFTVVAGALLITTVTFFLLWLGIYVRWLTPLVKLLDTLYLSANSGFYLVFFLILLIMYGIIFSTRWLDYWEFMPNEILHHHGPWSDLERFPTLNLKFDKEIPDIFEHTLFGAGRLVVHVANEQKSIVLDNVMNINRKEAALKQIMSRLEVRVTTDQEVGPGS